MVAPLSLPMVSITGTGLVVPVKLARSATAKNPYRKVPVGAISTCRPVRPTMVRTVIQLRYEDAMLSLAIRQQQGPFRPRRARCGF